MSRRDELDTFIAYGAYYGRANKHIKVPDFSHLYVRYGPRWILGRSKDGPGLFHHVLDIATVEVKEGKRGQGVFTAFVAKIQKDHPGLHIFVENAAPDFQTLLLRLGFKEQPYDCFFLESTTERPDFSKEELRARWGSWRELHPDKTVPKSSEGDTDAKTRPKLRSRRRYRR